MFKVSYLIGTVKAIEPTEGSFSGDYWKMVPPRATPARREVQQAA